MSNPNWYYIEDVVVHVFITTTLSGRYFSRVGDEWAVFTNCLSSGGSMSVDPGTGLAVLGTALGSKELVVKMLGPTADYVGEGMKFWTEHGVKNLGRVFNNATKKLGSKLDSPGAVPPKVLKGILADGPFCEDELAADYFGGVLASSRTEVGRDDRGAALLALISRLSSYQLRSHFFFYSIIHILYARVTENIGDGAGRAKLQTFIPFSAYVAAMDFSAKEDFNVLASHIIFGLRREALIEEDFWFGSVEHVRSKYPAANEPGILFSPSVLGAELFMWAHGRGDLTAHAILNPDIDLSSTVELSTTSIIHSTRFPDRTVPPTADIQAHDTAQTRLVEPTINSTV